MQAEKPSLANLFKTAFKSWKEDQTSVLGAALAYYTVFSLAPLLLIAIAIAGLVFGQEAARNQISDQIGHLVGSQAANGIEAMVQGAAKKSSGIWATIIGVVALLLGASGVFGQLQAAMNQIWKVESKVKGGLLNIVKERFLSLSMVVGTCFLLLVSLLASAAVSALTKSMWGDSEGWSVLVQAIDLLISILVLTVLFSAIFKVLPDRRIPWRDCWWGGLCTAMLFAAGKTLIGLYIGRSEIASSYGAAGGIMVLLLWVYYSAQILFFGAELTKAYSAMYGSRTSIPVMPDREAKRARARNLYTS